MDALLLSEPLGFAIQLFFTYDMVYAALINRTILYWVGSET